MLKEELELVVEQTQRVLKENTGWRTRWAGYASNIRDSKPNIEEVRKRFRERPPLRVYLNITSAQKAKSSVNFDLRYRGQNVAKLKGCKDGKHKLSTKGYYERNQRYFRCNIRLSDEAWDGKKAGEFRKFFKDHDRKRIPNASTKKKNVEHRLESQFLTEFSTLEHKAIRNIKPVRFCGVRFPMPTPIIASKHAVPSYPGYGAKNDKGGGIDILARIGSGGLATRLCIMELKDENSPSEPPALVMTQAVAYATFIRELLRSDAGQDWWELFEFGGKIPESLELYAACVMPSVYKNDDSFGNMEFNISKNDTIKLHFLYFTEKEDGRITIEPDNTTLPIKPREP